jgi:diguanylate cyclase (GGDEF)-like protein
MERRRHFLPLLSLVLVVGFVATSLASFFVSRASLQSQITEAELPLTSDNIFSEIQRDLLRPLFISAMMAGDTFLRDWIVEGERDPTRIVRYLKEIQERTATFTSFFVSERSRIYYTPSGVLKAVDPAEPRDAWYFRLRDLPAAYEINVDPDMAHRDAMTIFINYKVNDDHGRMIGATGVGLRVGAVKGLIESYQARYQRTVYFVDHKGSVVLHGSAFDPQAVGDIRALEGIGAVAEQILKADRGSFRFSRGGRTVHLNSRLIPEFKWILLVEQSEGPALQRVFMTLLFNLGICALVTAVALFLAHAAIRGYRQGLERAATTDRLTGLANRQAWELLFQQVLSAARRKPVPIALMVIDVDRFKAINDTYGHLAGDAVLQEVSARIGTRIRENDLFSRWGGDEFLILLGDCGYTDALARAETIRAAFDEQPVVHQWRDIAVSVSIGVTRYRPGEDEDGLLQRVDQALYRAKAAGRNRVAGDPAEI